MVQQVKRPDEFSSVQGNMILGSNISMTGGSVITFHGEGNVLVLEDGVVLDNSSLTFFGNNSAVYISKSNKRVAVKASLQHNNSLFIGSDNYFNQPITIIFSEQKNVFIGDENLFSFGVMFRMADPHLIYDVKTHKRINPTRSILVGDHTWIGQEALILKGSVIGSGAIVAARSVLSGREYKSNCVWGGVGAKLMKEGVFFTSDSVHAWTDAQTDASQIYEGDDFIYTPGEDRIRVEDLDDALTVCLDGKSRANILREVLANGSYDNGRNRFAV